jgi:proline iminopeptidase
MPTPRPSGANEPGSPGWTNRPGQVQLVAERLTPERLAVLGRLGTLGSDEELRQAWYTLLPLYVYRPQSAGQYIARDRTIYRVRAFTRTFRLLAGFDTRAQLGRLTMPTLVAVGRYDWSTPVRHSQFLYKLILGAELVLFPESGHLPFLEEPGAFLDHLARFLAV